MTRITPFHALVAGAAALIAATAGAHPQAKSQERADRERALAGPAVEEQAGAPEGQRPPERRRFQGRGEQGQSDYRFFFQAVRALGSPEAPEDVRLTDDQRGQIREIFGEFHQAIRAYRQEHLGDVGDRREPAHPRRQRVERTERDAPPVADDGEKPRRAERPRRERDVAGTEPGPEPREKRRHERRPPREGPRAHDQAPMEMSDAERERRQEIMKDAPRPGPYITRAWEVLSLKQQEEVRWRMAAALENPEAQTEPQPRRLRREKQERRVERPQQPQRPSDAPANEQPDRKVD